MAEKILASVQVKRDSKANWEAANPVLLDGEAAYEKDTDMFKIGDGVNSYNNLSYHNKVGPKGDTGADGYTPVRGTDYWTAADQEQIVSDVLAALPNAQGVSF